MGEYMQSNETPQRTAGDEDIPDQDITEEEAAARTAEPEWQPGWGEKPLKDHVRNESTVDLEEGAKVRVHLGERVEDWAGDYPERSDTEARHPDATPGYDPANAFDRERYLSSGPNVPGEEGFDVHDYVESERVPENADLSGHINPQYD